MKTGRIISFEKMERVGNDFLDLMKIYEIEPISESEWEKLHLKLFDLKYAFSNQTGFDDKLDLQLFFSSVLGYYDFAEKILSVKNHSNFESLLPHFRLFNEGLLIQNSKSKSIDKASDKLFELYIAVLLMFLDLPVELDHPESSTGKNPDVISTYKFSKFAIACKCISGNNIKTIYDRIEDGIDQIERSSVDQGYVFINLKNKITHESLWPILNPEEVKEGKPPIWHAYNSVIEPLSSLSNYVHHLRKQLIETYSTDIIVQLFKNKKAIPIIVFMVQSGAPLLINGSPMPAPINFFQAIPVIEENYEILSLINDAMHSIKPET